MGGDHGKFWLRDADVPETGMEASGSEHRFE